jgi:8-amino-7-oxononanoate synthase
VYTHYQQFLSKVKGASKFRQLPKSSYPKNIRLNFASNDYLQLSKHSEILKAAQDALNHYGCGATGSRLLSGNYPLIEEFEAQIAKDKQTKHALIFSSGFQANLSVLAALLDKKILKAEPLVFFDKYNHASLYQAINLSQTKLIRYHHLDMNHLEEQLKKNQHQSQNKFIVSETVFGMDGDTAAIEDLIALCQKYDCFLYLDEAHATGLFGSKYYGLSTDYNLSSIPHLIMGTFSKALGSHGAYVACDEVIYQYLINNCQGLIYTTANSPLTIAAAFSAWKLLPHLNKEIEKLFQLANYLQTKFLTLGYSTSNSKSNIVSLLLKEELRTLELHQLLQSNGIIASAIRPPTVPPGTSRLRFAINTAHELQDLNDLIEVLKRC